MEIRFYGRLADLFGERLCMEGERCSVAELRERLVLSHPDAAEAIRDRRSRACVADVMLSEGDLLQPGEQVEILSPVSGG